MYKREQELLLGEILVIYMPYLVLWIVLPEKIPRGNPHAQSLLPSLFLVNYPHIPIYYPPPILFRKMMFMGPSNLIPEGNKSD